MKITKRQLRRLIREEKSKILRESKSKIPIPLENLQFEPDISGRMSLPGIGAYKSVRSAEEFSRWQVEFLEKYGPTMISWDHNGWNVQNKKFKAAVDTENKKFMTHHRSMERRLGRKLRY